MPKTIREIRKDWTGCTRCPLAEYRHGVDGSVCSRCSDSDGQVQHNTVLGEGSPKADIMIIGESPGEFEDHLGAPFIGPTGDILTLFLSNTGLLQEPLTEAQLDALVRRRLDGDAIRYARSNLFLTNLVACKTPDNRDPTQNEMDRCWPRVAAMIYAIDPLLIITVGRVASAYVAGEHVAIQAQRGTLRSVKFPGVFGDYEIPILMVLHPSFLMRNADKGPGGVWEKTDEDFTRAAEIVRLAKRAYRGEKIT
jgi:uracil-DNA glycosylase family 4